MLALSVSRFGNALFVSALLHGLVVAGFQARAERAQPAVLADRWVGSSGERSARDDFVDIEPLASEPHARAREASAAEGSPSKAEAVSPSTAPEPQRSAEKAAPGVAPHRTPPRREPTGSMPRQAGSAEVAAAAAASSDLAEDAGTGDASAQTGVGPTDGGPASERPENPSGASGLPPGVRPLGVAFTRALPYGSRLDRFWHRVPVGFVGRARVEIAISDAGALVEFRIDEEHAVAPGLRRMLERARALLERGQFAIGDRLRAGTEALEVEVSVSQRGAAKNEFANPNDVVEIGFRPPEAERAGRAYFTLASGRHVEATVTLGTKP